MNPKLRSYLAAPEPIRDAFDRQVKTALDRDLALDRWAEQELADDPLAVTGERRQVAAVLGLDPVPSTVNVRWTDSWQRRARAVRKSGVRAIYDRATDPLLAFDVREAWPTLTGEDVPRHGRVTCPHPDHTDVHPDCHLWADGWRCYGCNRHGDLIDLGGLLYGLTPRGSDFHRIRERLLADLGMPEAA